ncbi:YqaI family protein [Metabacillus sp. B2-18]|uniref:YqaI family protein n=1 Tax=Metabacillus sp. B2-18 TaxID=2897333 RepID=UPI001E455D71|nr:hypothetical protein [Metabacillus sp. B2-18]UGB31670.1 hypothetical protein LPC09_04100 [Metabacillus sp. B2-18]
MSAILKCPKCKKSFAVPEDEREDHDCPNGCNNQPEHFGVDYFGNEILKGDSIVIANGEIILEESLEDYLMDVLGFEYKKAK